MTYLDADDVMDSKIAALRKEFIAGLPGRIQTISSLLALLYDQPDHRQELFRRVHSITGSLGLFEYMEPSHTAREMCNLLDPDLPLDDVLYSLDELNVLAVKLFGQIEVLHS
ncbi:MAG TPA: hypothetical protein ENI64_09010 [Gammaproteobacteria bacterium]|nr:hypothetical protein [Gammaproteobacteria bacterium]